MYWLLLGGVLRASELLNLLPRASAAFGDPGTSDSIEIKCPLGSGHADDCNFVTIVQNFTTKVLEPIAFPVVSIMIIYGAFQILTAAGNEERIKSGRKTIQYAVIGFIIVLFAGSVVPILQSIFSK